MDSQVMKSFRIGNQLEDREHKLCSKEKKGKSGLKNIAPFRREKRNGVE